MNEAIVKWLALGTVSAVVMGALWLATSVQVPHSQAGIKLAAHSPSRASMVPSLHLAALPPQQAASGAFSARSQVSVR